MGSKPWLKVGSVLLAGMLLCGCQDPPRQNNSVTKMPPPDPAKVTTGTGLNGASNAPSSAWPATNSTVVKQTTPGTSNYASGSGGSVNGLPTQTPSGLGSSGSSLNPSTPSTMSSNFSSTPTPPLNPGFNSTPSASSNFAIGASSSSTGGLSSPLPPVGGPSSPGLPPPVYGTPSTFGPSPAAPR